MFCAVTFSIVCLVQEQITDTLKQLFLYSNLSWLNFTSRAQVVPTRHFRKVSNDISLKQILFCSCRCHQQYCYVLNTFTLNKRVNEIEIFKETMKTLYKLLCGYNPKSVIIKVTPIQCKKKTNKLFLMKNLLF